jgi:hypothetical protein
MVSILMRVYSSTASSELFWALPHPSTTALPPAEERAERLWWFVAA